MSFMLQHQEKALAGQQKKAATRANTELYKVEYKKWLGKLHKDQNAVKSLTDHSDRNEKAAEILDGYLEYLRSWLASGVTHQNDVLTQCVVWAVDGERWDILFELADPAIADPKVGNLHWMDRPLPQFVADQLLKSLKVEQDTDSEITVPVFEVLERIQEGRWPVNHVSSARYHKACGLIAEATQDWSLAVDLFTKADEIYPNIAVKGRLKEAIKALNDSTPDERPPVDDKPETSDA